MFRWLLMALLVLAPAVARAGDRVALLIGEGAYPVPPKGVSAVYWPPLDNPPNDVDLIGKKLASIGFKTFVRVDKTRNELRDIIKDFAAAAAHADDAVVYYAGHGFEYQRHNYLVPIDAPAELDASVLPQALIDFDDVAKAAGKARHVTIFFLDACRTANPELHLGGPAKPYVDDLEFQPGSQVVVLYSTARGESAYDQVDDPPPSNYSPFAWYLSQYITLPHTSINDMAVFVSNKVRQSTAKQGRQDAGPQSPFILASLNELYYLHPTGDASGSSGGATALAAVSSSGPGDATRHSRTRSTRGLGQGPGAGLGQGLGLTMDYLARTDEPEVVATVLLHHSVEDIAEMAEGGDPVAQYLLGYMHEFGRGAERDLAKARALLEQAAKSGSPPTLLELAYFLEHNDSYPGAKVRARTLLEAAAAQGFAKAEAHLASVLMDEGGVAGLTAQQRYDDYQRGVRLYEAAAKQDYPEALYALATLKRADAAARLEVLAHQGDSAADQWICELAASPLTPDALGHCRTAAKAGSYLSQAKLATAYQAGDGVAADPDEARHWARVALAQPELDPSVRARLATIAP